MQGVVRPAATAKRGERGDMVRVVINQFTALGQKTGIGHYTRQLYRRLLAQAGDDQIDAFPTGWLRRACRRVRGRC